MSDDTVGFKYLSEPPKQTDWASLKPKEPSLLKKASNLLEAITQITESGFKRVPESVSEERKKICKTCHFWKAEGNFGLGSCTKCGCSYLKQLYSVMACPIGNWGTHVE